MVMPVSGSRKWQGGKESSVGRVAGYYIGILLPTSKSPIWGLSTWSQQISQLAAAENLRPKYRSGCCKQE